MLSICYTLNMVYYALVFSYSYCFLLTPRAGFRKPLITCAFCMFLVLIPDIYLMPRASFLAPVLLWVSMLSALFLFRDSWYKRLIAFALTYITQIFAEILSYYITDLALSFFSDSKLRIQTGTAPEPWAVALIVASIIISGTLLAFVMTPFYKKWIHFFLTPTLLWFGIPLIVIPNTYIAWSFPKAAEHPLASILLSIFLSALCYPPLFKGLKELRKQARQRALLEKQHDLMEKQFQYISKLETEYRELRKWNHDISNHLLSVSWLMEQQQYTEADSYVKSILKKASAETNF